MISPDLNATAEFVVALLIHYSFDQGGYTAGELVERWLKDYPVNWVRLAMIEALYQGRYKAISVEQILSFWSRRGQALHHFNHEFERLICGNFFHLSGRLDTTTNPPSSDLEETGGEHQLHNKDQMSRSEGERLLSPNSASYPAIEQFTPENINGDFYIKLKAIAQQPKD